MSTPMARDDAAMSSMSRAMLCGFGLALAGAGSLQVQAAGRHEASAVAPHAQAASAQTQAASPGSAPAIPQRALLDRYCVTCHNERLRTAGLALDVLDVNDVSQAPAVWERVVHKLRGGMMPPTGRPRPAKQVYDDFATWLEAALDAAAAERLEPGRVPTHRLNRAEYGNAIRDLLALDVDPVSLLPPDSSGRGFDNIAGNLAMSPALLDRYLMAARRTSRLAVGDPTIGPALTSATYVVPITMVQDDRMGDEMPFGSRGGIAVHHRFPLDGQYTFTLRLKRSVYEFIVNLGQRHDLDVRVDRVPVALFEVGGETRGNPAPISYSGTIPAARGLMYPTQEWEDYQTSADVDLTIRVAVKAGLRLVTASFVEKSWEKEGVAQPQLREYAATVTETTDTSERPEGPGLESLTIEGPYAAVGPGETPSRSKILVCGPSDPAEEEPCATRIFSTLARRAYRRPVTAADIEPLLAVYRAGRRDGGFDGGIQAGLERLLIDPEFLFRVERDPAGVALGGVYRLSDLELASRLSFFLWSSIPDDELLDVATRQQLRDPAVLEAQTRRMLAGDRSEALVENFASQWLSLRSVGGASPDPNLFPQFDENLREAFLRETELFIEHQLREDRSVVELLSADYTFVNERLARHYEIPNVLGSRYRRVPLPDARRGGLLGHGSILTVTSYGNRTSPVLRAKWLLENILGTPPPPPPGRRATVPG